MENGLEPGRSYWVPAVVAPCRDWPGKPGCRKGARFLISASSFGPGSSDYPLFERRSDCLQWIMRHRLELARHAPDAQIAAVDLARWMLGLS